MIIKSLKSELEALGLLQESKKTAPVAPAGRLTDARGIFSRKRMARKLRARFEEMTTKIKREFRNDPGSRIQKLFEELKKLTDEVIMSGERTVSSEPDRPKRMEALGNGVQRDKNDYEDTDNFVKDEKDEYDGVDIRVDIRKSIPPQGEEREALENYLKQLITKTLRGNAKNFNFDWGEYHHSVFVTLDLVRPIHLTYSEMLSKIKSVERSILKQDKAGEHWVEDVDMRFKPKGAERSPKGEDYLAHRGIRLCLTFMYPVLPDDLEDVDFELKVIILESFYRLPWPKRLSPYGVRFDIDFEAWWEDDNKTLCAWIKFDRSVYLTPEEVSELDDEYIQRVKRRIGALFDEFSLEDMWTEWH
jgi:hypothetical protein